MQFLSFVFDREQSDLHDLCFGKLIQDSPGKDMHPHVRWIRNTLLMSLKPRQALAI